MTPAEVQEVRLSPLFAKLTDEQLSCLNGGKIVDVPVGSNFYTYIEALAQMGATSGYLDGTYRPDSNAMRGHISKVIVLAQGWAIDTTGGPHFTDVPPLSAFYPYVETAYNRHIIGGYHEEDFEIWDSKGQLCAQARQLALVA